jgi:hypothetical protein
MLPEDASRIDRAALGAAGIAARHVPASRWMGVIRFRNDPPMNAAGHRYCAEGLLPILSEPLLEIRRQRGATHQPKSSR